MKSIILFCTFVLSLFIGCVPSDVSRNDIISIQQSLREINTRLDSLQRLVQLSTTQPIRSTEIIQSPAVVPPSISPPSTEQPTSIQKEKKKTEVSTGQCIATTKKGKQCSRKASPGSSYCWQHK